MTEHKASPRDLTGLAAVSRRTLLVGSTLASVASALPVQAAAGAAHRVERDLNFDTGWRFWLGDDPAASRPEYNDTAWHSVDLPHDWSLEDRPGAPLTPADWQAPSVLWSNATRPKDAATFGPGMPIVVAQIPPPVAGGAPQRVGPFDAAASGGGWTTGWVVGGVGWYRKTFTLARLAPGEHVEIRFDGAYRETQVWINGVELGRNVNGYLGFAFDLTPHLRPDSGNVIAVRVANEGDNSRWYSGSGIYRHVWLSRTGNVRVPLWGTSIHTVSADAGAAQIAVGLDLEYHGADPVSASVQIAIRGPSGAVVARAGQTVALSGGSSGRAEATLTVPRPALWSPERPELYQAEISIGTPAGTTDAITQRFGIRTLTLSPATGFCINGKSYKLKGVCLHHDNGLLGASAIDAAERRKVELMKASGFNAIRGAHNPFSPHFLDVCDELGMIVIDEAFDAWEKPKRKDDYHVHFAQHWRSDLTAMIRRDRNHPSIAFWSIGNEIAEITSPRGSELAGQLREVVRELDPTRFVTAALTQMNQGPGGEPARRHLDVSGYNYMAAAAVRDHGREPEKVFMNTESYGKDIHAIWQDVEKYPWLLGDFLWTGMDYLGEVGLGSSRLQPLPPPRDRNFLDIFLWDYPAFQSGCGDLDILGRKKPQGFYRDVVWGRSQLEVFVQRPVPANTYEDVSEWGWHDELRSWTWPGQENNNLTVRCYTPGDEVIVLLNGLEVGRQALASGNRMKAELPVAYRPGELVVIALAQGREIGRRQLKTAGTPAQIRVRAEKGRIDKNRGALAYVFADILDRAGTPVPDAAVPISFVVEGAGRLIAAGSANPRSVESLRDGNCRTFHGEALAIIAPTGRRGEIRVRATATGLTAQTVAVQTA